MVGWMFGWLDGCGLVTPPGSEGPRGGIFSLLFAPIGSGWVGEEESGRQFQNKQDVNAGCTCLGKHSCNIKHDDYCNHFQCHSMHTHPFVPLSQAIVQNKNHLVELSRFPFPTDKAGQANCLK